MSSLSLERVIIAGMHVELFADYNDADPGRDVTFSVSVEGASDEGEEELTSHKSLDSAYKHYRKTINKQLTAVEHLTSVLRKAATDLNSNADLARYLISQGYRRQE